MPILHENGKPEVKRSFKRRIVKPKIRYVLRFTGTYVAWDSWDKKTKYANKNEKKVRRKVEELNRAGN